MNRIFRATALLGTVALSAVSVAAAEPANLGNEVGNQIAVVNHSVAAVRVYIEDSAGRLHELGSVGQGQATTFAAPADIVSRGDFRVVVRPGHYAQFTKDQVSIKTRALNVDNADTVVLWLDRELSRSMVEVREG